MKGAASSANPATVPADPSSVDPAAVKAMGGQDLPPSLAYAAQLSLLAHNAFAKSISGNGTAPLHHLYAEHMSLMQHEAFISRLNFLAGAFKAPAPALAPPQQLWILGAAGTSCTSTCTGSGGCNAKAVLPKTFGDAKRIVERVPALKGFGVGCFVYGNDRDDGVAFGSGDSTTCKAAAILT